MHGDLVVVDDVPGEFAERVIEAFHGRPNDGFSLAVSGGETARRVLRAAGRRRRHADRLVEGRRLLGRRALRAPRLARVELPPRPRVALLEQVGAVNANYPMFCEEGPDPYQLRLGELGQLDVVHLGLGADGHIASLFPGSPGLDADPGRLVVMNEDPSGRNPHPRMTLTFAGIARARLVLVTVAGEAKRDALARGRRRRSRLPRQPTCTRDRVVLDRRPRRRRLTLDRRPRRHRRSRGRR